MLTRWKQEKRNQSYSDKKSLCFSIRSMHHLINSEIMAGSSLGCQSLHYCGCPKPPSINTGTFGNIAGLCKAYQSRIESMQKWNEWRAIHPVQSMASQRLSWGMPCIAYNGVAHGLHTNIIFTFFASFRFHENWCLWTNFANYYSP